MSEQTLPLVGTINDLPIIDVSDFILGADKRVIFGPGRFWDDYVMRTFTLHPGSVAPPNSHPWMHWAVCLGGEGKLKLGEDEYEWKPGTYMHTPGNLEHTFWNTSKTEDFVILCIVPAEGDVNPLGKPMGC